MKKFILSALLLGFLTVNGAMAQTWQVGYPNTEDITATFADGTLTISGTGDMQNWLNTIEVWRGHATRSNIHTVIVEEGVTSIGNFAFFFCDGLTSVTIPASVTHIGTQAFSMTGLTSITLGSGVATLGNFVFLGSSNLTSIDVAPDNPNISLIDGVLFNKDQTVLILYSENKSGTSYIIPNSVETIGNTAFSNNRNLTSVTISNSVTTIGISAFSGSALTSVTIGGSVTTIGDWAFLNCTALRSIVSLNPVPPAVSANAFNNVNRELVTLYVVSDEALALYQNAEVWQDFLNIQVLETSNVDVVNVSKIQIFPNPVLDSFQIGGITENTLVKIIDTNGRIVLQQMVSPNEQISVGHLSVGMYFVQVNGETVKIVKR